MTLDDMPSASEAIAAVEKVMELPVGARINYLEMLGCSAIHYMRALHGDEYTRGWLDSAIADLDRPPMLVLRKPS